MVGIIGDVKLKISAHPDTKEKIPIVKLVDRSDEFIRFYGFEDEETVQDIIETLEDVLIILREFEELGGEGCH